MLCSYDDMEDDSFDFDLPSHELPYKEINVYEFMNPRLKELSAAMQGRAEPAHMEAFLRALDGLNNEFIKNFTKETYGEKGPIGTIVSSNAATNTATRTHGQKGKPKKRKQHEVRNI